jgi:hypothetical protein
VIVQLEFHMTRGKNKFILGRKLLQTIQHLLWCGLDRGGTTRKKPFRELRMIALVAKNKYGQKFKGQASE